MGESTYSRYTLVNKPITTTFLLVKRWKTLWYKKTKIYSKRALLCKTVKDGTKSI